MPKRKSNIPLDDASAPQVKRRWRRFLFWSLLLILIGAAVSTGGLRLRSPWSKPGYHTLPELLASVKYRGFEIVQEPDRPGPYMEISTTTTGKGESAINHIWANGKMRQFNIPGVPGAELRVVGLEPEDGGEPTFMVLRSSSPAGPK